jgi:two-component system cell cycle sensor histidine kinase/response regulator CckA
MMSFVGTSQPEATAGREGNPEARPPRVKADRCGNHHTILLAEDSEPVRDVLSQFLSKSGYRVFTAADPDEAERLVAEHGEEIDLLVADVIMPKRSGPDLYQRMLATHPDMKVLFISGYFETNAPVRQELPPGAEFMRKPFNLAELDSRIRKILN